ADEPPAAVPEPVRPPAVNTVAVAGRVLDPDGKPVPAARVSAIRRAGESSSGETLRVVARGAADAEGHFRLDVPTTQDDPPPGGRGGGGRGGPAVGRGGMVAGGSGGGRSPRRPRRGAHPPPRRANTPGRPAGGRDGGAPPGDGRRSGPVFRSEGIVSTPVAL